MAKCNNMNMNMDKCKIIIDLLKITFFWSFSILFITNYIYNFIISFPSHTRNVTKEDDTIMTLNFVLIGLITAFSPQIFILLNYVGYI